MNLLDIFKNMQPFRSQMNDLIERFDSVITVGRAGGDMVTVTLRGRFEVVSVEISPEAYELGDREILQELVKSAFTDANNRFKEWLQEEGSKATGGMNVPPEMLGL